MELPGLIGILSLWGTLGAVAWSAALIARGGRAPVGGLPLAVAIGIGAGAAVPALGAKDFAGLWLSLAAALVGGAAASMAAARLRRGLNAES